MQKTKSYQGIKFSPRLIRKAVEACDKLAERASLSVETTIGDEQWKFDTLEEFLASFGDPGVHAAAVHVHYKGGNYFEYYFFQGQHLLIKVTAPSRAEIESIFAIFQQASPDEKEVIPTQRKTVTIFIGHGRSTQWLKLKSHLQDKHGLDVEAYETGSRAGHTIRDILDSMAEGATMALLVLTGEDKSEDGLRARQNVIHECGLFQGKLGFDRAIMLVEKGIKLASNFDGIQQIRFAKGHIAETFGDVIATIHREFGTP